MPRLRFVSTVEGVNTIELEEPLITVGRGINNVVCIEDANISKHHALLIQEDDTYKLIDLHSVNGTCVNGQRITVARLKEGDAVRIGYLELMFEIALTLLPGPPWPFTSANCRLRLPRPRPRLARVRGLALVFPGSRRSSSAAATVELPPPTPALQHYAAARFQLEAHASAIGCTG